MSVFQIHHNNSEYTYIVYSIYNYKVILGLFQVVYKYKVNLSYKQAEITEGQKRYLYLNEKIVPTI